MDKQRIFLVEDDQNFGAVLKSYLEIHDYRVEWINDGANAIAAFKAGDFDICLLDVMLPNIDGFDIARNIRSLNETIPLIFLTAKTLKSDILEGFKIGADDYITKPFDSEVLLCKINAILKRNTGNHTSNVPNEFEIGKYRFNYELRCLYDGNKEQKMSPKEAELLRMLFAYKNTVLTRDKALYSIWGDSNYFTTRSMDVYITKLRKYLKKDSSIEILNIHGSGYRLTF